MCAVAGSVDVDAGPPPLGRSGGLLRRLRPCRCGGNALGGAPRRRTYDRRSRRSGERNPRVAGAPRQDLRDVLPGRSGGGGDAGLRRRPLAADGRVLPRQSHGDAPRRRSRGTVHPISEPRYARRDSPAPALHPSGALRERRRREAEESAPLGAVPGPGRDDFRADCLVAGQVVLRVPELALVPLGDSPSPSHGPNRDALSGDIDGDVDNIDAAPFETSLGLPTIQDNVRAFDFDNDSVLTPADVDALRRRVLQTP